MSLVINLPAPQDPPLSHFTVTVPLDGTTYTIALHWNDVDTSWYATILDEPGQTVLAGAWRVTADWPLFRSQVQRHPPGLLMCVDSSGQGLDPGLSDLGAGARCPLIYFTQAELLALGLAS